MRNATRWPGAFALFFLCLVVSCAGTAVAAPSSVPAATAAPVAPADCSKGTLVTVVAHLDDDLLFVNPGISDHLRAGWCVVTVHLIGGANSSAFDYVLKRERGVRQAYARMAGVPNVWAETTATIAGKPVHRMVLAAMPRVTLLELRLPGGQVRGGRVPLGLLWDEGETLSSYPMHADGSGATHYDRTTLTATLEAILARATHIYTLNPDTVAFLEHPDHIYAARITRAAALAAGLHVPLRYHFTYVTAGMPANLSAEATQDKRDQVASYFAIDGGDIAQVFGEYEWNGDWVARRYAFGEQRGVAATAAAAGSAPALPLVNVHTSRCLSANSGNDEPTDPHARPEVRLAACDSSAARAWRWQPLPSYPGNPHNAALVSALSGRCVAERAGALVEEPCAPDDIAQRFTPWDFGIVRTPLDHCLGDEGAGRESASDAKPTLAACRSLTTAYRWTSAPASPWTDTRTAGALYGDVTGTGHPSAVYVQRRTDGPGFDIWVTALTPGTHPTRWYASPVPFDAKAIAPSCHGSALCFDSTRFVLGDFEGNGRTDLMAIAPDENGGTAFWRLASTGHAFAAPILWYRSGPTLTPGRAQQYVAADFDGDGRTDVVVAERTQDDAGFDLWLLASKGSSARAPALWRQAAPLVPATEFFAAHVFDSAHPGLIAVERDGATLALSQLPSSGHGFALRYRTDILTGTRPAFTRIAAGRVDASGLDGLILLQAREPDAADHANIDVSMLAPGRRFGAPVHIGTIGDVAWTDARPSLVSADRDGKDGRHDDERDKAPANLVLFERTDALLDDFHFTGGAPALRAYSLATGSRTQRPTLRPLPPWGTLPGRYSETMRLDLLK
ncbi:PIG-L family deacetylase [Trinickia sp. LjRoot230]|uniref:PIG-L family deacetylase n=1 Tax=Trinickia sp. LjRoot230 TaxID=3342288 RepID=UPI003ECEE731